MPIYDIVSVSRVRLTLTCFSPLHFVSDNLNHLDRQFPYALIAQIKRGV